MAGIEKWIESIINSKGADVASQSQTEKPPRINRVSQMLRDTKDFGNYYVPRFVSIGPYHYDNPNLQQVQNVKHRIASKFISNDRHQLKVLYEKLFEMIKEVKECYDENVKYIFDEKLAKMMLLDGCFILHYIKCVVGEKIYKHDLEMKSHVIAFVRQDLFLLENQLPFFVLRVLIMNNSTTLITEDQWMENINVFIQKNIMAPQNKEWKELRPLDYEMERPAHLLELLHRRMVSPIYYMYTRPKLVRFTFRSLKELAAVGINLKPEDTDQRTDIDYDCPNATLKIPSITVNESTRSKLLNLIAYEMCPDA